MMFGYLKSRSGQSSLILVTVICAMSVMFFLHSADVHRKNIEQSVLDYDQLLLDEVTTSAFALVEAALIRRLWEPPPDNSCLKASSFDLNGELENGLTWKIDVTYDHKSKNYEFLASGRLKNRKTSFSKKIKVLDVSDYLIYNASTKDLVLERGANETAVSSIIAKDRRVYSNGKIVFRSSISRANPTSNSSPVPATWPGEFGNIIQGDRIQFLSGVKYSPHHVHPPLEPSHAAYPLVNPYALNYGIYGAGFGVITRNYQKATDLKNQIMSQSPGPLGYSDIQKEVYPMALFDSGTWPLNANSAVDNGTFFNDAQQSIVVNYQHDGGYWARVNYTCLSPLNYNAAKKECSNSEHFPNGFKKWRESADLEGVLFTSDAEEVPSPALTWDNMQALKEDAVKCGAVIEAPQNAYFDCPLWDKNFYTRYAQGTGTCQEVSRIDLNGLSFSNLSDSFVAANESRILRRVVYSTVPIEIAQTNQQGLMIGQIPTNTNRRKFPLWIVNESVTALKGFQQDTTSPLDERPAELREVVFNKDVTGVLEPIPMVMLSPDSTHLLSPFYVPADMNYLNTYLPVVGGKVRPVLHSFTDYPRQEEDGFKYGYRRFILENISLISNTKNNVSKPFYLRGLWSEHDGFTNLYISNMCMVSDPSYVLNSVSGQELYRTAAVPTVPPGVISPLPSSSSRFYGGQTVSFPRNYFPSVFSVQKNVLPTGFLQSLVEYSGIRIYLNFADDPAFSTSLNNPKTSPLGSLEVIPEVSLEHKTFEWTLGQFFSPAPFGSACTGDNARTLASGVSSLISVMPSMNRGEYIFLHSDPPDHYRNLGSILGVNQPLIQIDR